jgi:hypothetical protein
MTTMKTYQTIKIWSIWTRFHIPFIDFIFNILLNFCFTFKNEENGVEGDLGLEFYDLDGSDDPVRKVKTTSTTARSAILKYV